MKPRSILRSYGCIRQSVVRQHVTVNAINGGGDVRCAGRSADLVATRPEAAERATVASAPETDKASAP